MSCPTGLPLPNGPSASGWRCSCCGALNGDWQPLSEPLPSSAPEYALRAIQICQEVETLVPTLRGYVGVVRQSLRAGPSVMYNVVRFGLDVERLLRALASLLRLVIDMRACDPGASGRKGAS